MLPKSRERAKCLSDSLLDQVFLSKQQTTDLSGKVQKLLFEKDAIERLGIDGLRVQLARTKAVRQKASARCFVFLSGHTYRVVAYVIGV